MASEDNVALYSYALLTEAQFSLEAAFGEAGSANEQIGAIREILNSVTDIVEEATDRILIYRGAATARYYTIPGRQTELILDEWPVRAVSVWESSDRLYTDATLLVENTDYIIESSARGAKIIRIAGVTDGPTCFEAGFRSVKVSCQEGFRRSDQTSYTNDLLPGQLRRSAARIAARMWAEVKRKKHGIMSATDAGGTVTRFSDSYISLPDAGILRNNARSGMGGGRRGST